MHPFGSYKAQIYQDARYTNIKIISVIWYHFENDVEVHRISVIVRRECVWFGTISVSKYIDKILNLERYKLSGQVRLQCSERAIV